MTYLRPGACLDISRRMEPTPIWLDHLKLLAASESLRLEAVGKEGLQDLVERGLIQKDEHPKQAGLESRYEALQETHRAILEARGCADRLQRRMSARSLLGGLLPMGGAVRPGPNDPDVLELLSLLERLKLQLRGVGDPEQLPDQLERIQDHLQVEGRDCLDRLADTDREIDKLQKQTPSGTLVEPEGFFILTRAGEAALPEARVLDAFETVLQATLGAHPFQSSGSAHFREDPASLLVYFLEGLARDERPSALMTEYEQLLEAYERNAHFAELRPLRAKIGFLVRLLRASREEPKRAYLWCNRERLHALLGRIRPLVPASVAASGWHLPYAADLFLADGGLFADEAQADLRTQLFEAVHRLQSDQLQGIRIADGQFVRLALALTHAARVRNFTPGILLDRFLRQAFDTVHEAAQAAPYHLGDRATRLLFGVHLAHAAGYTKAKLASPLAAFAALYERLQGEGHAHTLPVQAQLHAFATLERLERLGTPVPIDTYVGILARLRKHLNHHKIVSRAFRTEQALVGDEAALIANLCARVCFQDVVPSPRAKRHPDVGAAGLYESRDAGLPPLLGSPFGTLMLS